MAHNSSMLVRVTSAALLSGNDFQLWFGGLHRTATFGGTLSCRITEFSCLDVSCASLFKGQRRVSVQFYMLASEAAEFRKNSG